MLLTMRRRNTTRGLFYGSRKTQLWKPPEGKVPWSNPGPGKIPSLTAAAQHCPVFYFSGNYFICSPIQQMQHPQDLLLLFHMLRKGEKKHEPRK